MTKVLRSYFNKKWQWSYYDRQTSFSDQSLTKLLQRIIMILRLLFLSFSDQSLTKLLQLAVNRAIKIRTCMFQWPKSYEATSTAAKKSAKKPVSFSDQSLTKLLQPAGKFAGSDHRVVSVTKVLRSYFNLTTVPDRNGLIVSVTKVLRSYFNAAKVLIITAHGVSVTKVLRSYFNTKVLIIL